MTYRTPAMQEEPARENELSPGSIVSLAKQNALGTLEMGRWLSFKVWWATRAMKKELLTKQTSGVMSKVQITLGKTMFHVLRQFAQAGWVIAVHYSYQDYPSAVFVPRTSDLILVDILAWMKERESNGWAVCYWAQFLKPEQAEKYTKEDRYRNGYCSG